MKDKVSDVTRYIPTNLLQTHKVKGSGLNREEEQQHVSHLPLALFTPWCSQASETWAVGKVVENYPKWV